MPDEIFELSGSALPTELPGGTVIVAPGLVGTGTYLGRRSRGEVRAATQERNDFDVAIEEAGLEDRHTITLEAPTPTVPARGLSRGGEAELQDNEVLLEVPSALHEFQYAIYQDEDGVVTFHFPTEVAANKSLATRAVTREKVFRYRLELRPVVGGAPQHGVTRGIIGQLAKKLLKVVVGKITDYGAQFAAYGLVWAWENNCRSFEGFHGGQPQDLLADRPTAFMDWKSMDKQRSLLFIHGTTSSTSGAFSKLSNFADVAGKLYGSYGGRVIGFNHHTLTKTVVQNVVDFYKQLAQFPGTYEFDVVTHSRGGLVARTLKELSPSELGSLAGGEWRVPTGVIVNIRRVVFVGTPNNGTDLADPENIPAKLDRLATIVSLLPDSGATIALGAVFSWAGTVAQGVLKGLPGLCDQCTDSALLKALNAPAATGANPGLDYFAVQSNYTPSGGLAKAILNAGVDRLFGEKQNDLVVPTLGVSEIDSSMLDENRVKYFGQNGRDNVAHTDFFSRSETWSHILAQMP
jgi:pimeloyl-ACP methyl ester carboxylesterase